MSGLIPYEEGGNSSSLGTHIWQFKETWTRKINGFIVGTANKSENKNTIPTIASDGAMEIGKIIDFHVSAENDYDVRLTGSKSALTCSGVFSANSVRLNGTSHAAFGYDSSTQDVYIAAESNYWLRLKKNSTISFAGNNVCISGWGTGDPNGNDGKPIGSVYFKY